MALNELKWNEIVLLLSNETIFTSRDKKLSGLWSVDQLMITWIIYPEISCPIDTLLGHVYGY
jgi:hypothetical protein